jgi:small subunit ribosomal protein S4e
MVKNHLKRLAVPKSWPIKKKSTVYVTRPLPGAHPINLGMPLNIVLKEILEIAKTSREVREIIRVGIFVDGRQVRDEKYLVGFMDVITFTNTEDAYRLLINKNGFIAAVKLDQKESKIKMSKITGKTLVRGKMQLNLLDGRNILVDKDEYKKGDVLLLELPTQKIKEKVTLEKGSKIYLLGGRHIGQIHTVENVTGKKIALRSEDGQVFETLREYAFAVGKDKPILGSVSEINA